jgi:RNA polymerase-binding transcription factor DksA
MYIFGGFLLGVVVAISGTTAYAAVQSMVGKKVTGEMVVIVDGQTLADKGAVIEGKTNAPVRALAESLGVDLSVEGKNIYISTSKQEVSQNNEELLKEKERLEASIKSTESEIQKTKEKMENAKIPGTDKYEGEETWKGALKNLEDSRARKQVELDKINEALKQFE